MKAGRQIREVEHTTLAVLFLTREARSVQELAPQVAGYTPAQVVGALRRLRSMRLADL